MGDLPDTVGDLLNTVGDLPNTVGDLPNTVGDLPNTVGDLPSIVGDLPNTMGDLPNSSCFFHYHPFSSGFGVFFFQFFCFSPFTLFIYPVSSSLFYKFNSRSSALIALALFTCVNRGYLVLQPVVMVEV